MFRKVCKYAAFASVALLIIYMAAMTVLEKYSGTAVAMKWGYHSPLFIALWAIAALAGACYYVKSAGRLNIAVTAIHLSFLLILSGALVTHLSGVQGAMHLRLGDRPVSQFTRDDLQDAALPFSVSLKDFKVIYYPGTFTPTDYVSTIEISEGTSVTELSVSMNRIAKWRGYRFYQSSYDDDGRGSTLAVSHDPAGVPLTYSGYGLLFLSFIMFFFQRNSHFRAVLKRVSGMAAGLAILLAAGMMNPTEALAGTRGEVPGHLPEETAKAYGEMYIYYNGRICPVQTLARDFTMKLYGRQSYMGLTPEQVLTGWIFHYSDWNKTLDQNDGASKKAVRKASQNREIARLLTSGTLLKIFPYADAEGKVVWYSSVDRLPAEMDPNQWIFVRKVMSLAGENIVHGEYEEASGIFGKILEYQQKTAGDDLPTGTRIAAEKFYNSVERPKAAAMGCLCVGIVLFAIFCLSRRTNRRVMTTGMVLSAVVFLYLSFILALRWYVSGHAPLSNGFEVMMVLAWMAMLPGMLFQRRFSLILPLSFLLCGFALLVASIGESDPAIAYLVPVLSSPLLSLHVMTMMISYTLLGLVMLNSAAALVKYGGSPEELSAAADVSCVFLYPAVFFLATGTFIGAIWANVSWGSYWSWDPKEVWALITLLVYSLALHSGSLRAFSRPRFFHWFCVVAFLCVIVTYFGVNFFLGGMHSYT